VVSEVALEGADVLRLDDELDGVFVGGLLAEASKGERQLGRQAGVSGVAIDAGSSPR
jgi:hypothetical protein